MTNNRIPTTERLAQALEAENDPRLSPLIERARAGHYDCFKSPLMLPLIELTIDLRKLGYAAFSQRVLRGEFDAQDWEATEWFLSPEGQEVYNEVMGDLEQ